MFIIGIRKHPLLGYIASAHIIEKFNNNFYKTTQTVVKHDIDKNTNNYTVKQRKIVNIINQYSDKILLRHFSKDKTISIATFFANIDEALINERIRPYIERRLQQIIEILKNAKITIFLTQNNYQNIYNNDKVIINENPATAIFNFIRTEDEIKYFLTINHNQKEKNLYAHTKIILSNNPCIIILRNELYFFNDIDAKKLSPFFKKEYISVEKRMEDRYFKSFVAKSIKNYQVNATGFEIVNEKPKKQVILSIENDWKNEYVIIPKFMYDEIGFYHSEKKIKSVSYTNNNNQIKFNVINRDFEWEKNNLKFLENLELKLDGDINYKIKKVWNINNIQKIKTISWFSNNHSKLQKKGFRVVQKFKDKKYFTNNISIDFKIEKKIDWFDIFSIVKFGDFEIQFIRLKKHILQEKREYILPNGEIAIIPEEWFGKYRNIFLFGEEDDNKIKINKFHLSAIDKTDLKQINKKEIKKLLDFFSNKNKKTLVTPWSVRANLRDYQKKGFTWLNALNKNNFGGCLADDMGLGKTLQTLTIIAKSIEEASKKDDNKSTTSEQLSFFNETVKNTPNKEMTNLIISPTSLIHNWKNEIRKFVPSLNIAIYTRNERNKLRNKLLNYDIILSSYGIVRNDYEFLSKINFYYIVLDESQYIKNSNSKTYQAIVELQSKHKLTLTGTPIENSLKDLWSQMNFLNKGLLGSLKFFINKFLIPIEKNNDEKQAEKLKKIISPFILRRTKDIVAKDLPPLTEQTIYCEMSEEQEKIYTSENSKIRNKILELIDDNQLHKSGLYIVQALSKLRQIANHPKMINNSNDLSSGKFDEISDKINSLIAQNHKILIFSSFVKHLDLFAKYFEELDLEYSILTGSTKNREAVIDKFQNNENNRLFLISIKAGGVGLNLTAADYVFIIDPWWNPATEKQAISRAHRIGQNKKIMVYRFISKDTIEEKIQKLQLKKQKIADTFISSKNIYSEFSEQNILDMFI